MRIEEKWSLIRFLGVNGGIEALQICATQIHPESFCFKTAGYLSDIHSHLYLVCPEPNIGHIPER